MEPLTMLAAAMKVVGIGEKIGALLGFVETLEGKVTRLGESHLGAALESLEQAHHSTNDENALEFIRQAIERLNQAVHIESGGRLAWAYVLRSECMAMLGEPVNAQRDKTRALAIKPSFNIKAQFGAHVDRTFGDTKTQKLKGIFSGTHVLKSAQHLARMSGVMGEDARAQFEHEGLVRQLRNDPSYHLLMIIQHALTTSLGRAVDPLMARALESVEVT